MRNAEAQIQAAIVAWVREICPKVVVYAVPNDGLYTKSEAAKRKWTGVLAGVPDLAIVHPGGAGFLEIKTPGQKPRPEQVEIMDTLKSVGARCAVVHSLEEAKAALSAWGIYTEPKESAA